MKTENMRIASFLLVRGHALKALELNDRGYGRLTFDDSALVDVAEYDRGALVEAKKFADTLSVLIHRVEDYREMARGARKQNSLQTHITPKGTPAHALQSTEPR